LEQHEIDEAIRIINKHYPEGLFPYQNIYNILVELKLETLKNGLMTVKLYIKKSLKIIKKIQGSLNKLEVYLTEIFEKYDDEKKGLIHISDVMKALKKSDKIVLSKI
jgi:hypothetical protein